jgi:hypothetical protein
VAVLFHLCRETFSLTPVAALFSSGEDLRDLRSIADRSSCGSAVNGCNSQRRELRPKMARGAFGGDFWR